MGIHFNPKLLRTREALQILHGYMAKREYAPDGATYHAYPIMYLYQGCQFDDRIFLVGDAAGMASKLTGEGISFAIISGREVARKIIDPEYEMVALSKALKNKRKQEKLVDLFEKIPVGLNFGFNLLFKAMRLRLFNPVA